MAAEEVKFVFSMDDQFSKQAKTAESNIGGLESKLSSLGQMVVGAFSVSAIASFGQAVIESYGKMEMFQVALTTMLQGNKNEANALNDQLIQLAKTTPFELQDVQDGARQLLAYGSEAGKITEELTTLGNVAAGIGAPIKDITYLYGTIRTQGRAMTVDINQFANRGIPIWKELAKITGQSGLALRKLVEEGKIGFPQIQQVFANLTQEGGQFFNLMEEQSKTLSGQISNLNDSWTQFKVNLGTTFSQNLKDSIAFLSTSLNDINTHLMTSNRLQKSLMSQGVGLKYGQINEGAYLYNFQEGISTFFDGKKVSDDQKIKQLQNMARGLTKEFKKNYPDGTAEFEDNERYIRKIAIIKGEIEKYKGDIDLAKSKDKGNLADKQNATTAAPKKEAEKLRTPNYTQITINIDQMTGVENLTTQDNKMIPINIGDEILKLMTKGVTDAQIVAGARI